jgi:CheY-like chemotaxis protein
VATIVIADDSPTLRRIVTSVLTKEGHEVPRGRGRHRRRAEGLRAPARRGRARRADAARLGFIAARVLKDDWQTADIPVVMLTSSTPPPTATGPGQAGVDRYLTKDFEAGRAAATINEVLLAGTAARAAGRRSRPTR